MISPDQRHRLTNIIVRYADAKATQGAMVTPEGRDFAERVVERTYEEVERYLDFLETGEYLEETT